MAEKITKDDFGYTDGDLKSVEMDSESCDGERKQEVKEFVKKVSPLRAFAMCVKACMGSGLLALPGNFARSGWLFGVALLTVAGVFMTLGTQILYRCMWKKGKDGEQKLVCRTFEDIAELWLGKFGRTLASCFMNIIVMSLAAVMLVSGSSSMANLVPLDDDEIANKRYWILILTALVWIPSLVRKLHFIGTLCLLGVVGVLVGPLICTWISAARTGGDYAGDTSTVAVAGGMQQWALSLVGFCYALNFGIASPVTISTMANPKKYPAVNIAAYGFAYGLYMVQGCVVYAVFGKAFLGMGTVLNAVPSSEPEFWIINIGNCCSVIAEYFVLFNIPAISICNSRVAVKLPGNETVRNTLIRSVLVLISGGVAISTPKIGVIIDLIAAPLVLLTLVFPATCYFRKLYLEREEGETFMGVGMKSGNFFVNVMLVIGMIIGTVAFVIALTESVPAVIALW